MQANRDEWTHADGSRKKFSKPNMIYMKHNLKHNFHYAANAKDTAMKVDILLTEVAKLVVFNPERVQKLLADYGYPVKRNMNKRQLSRAISTMLNRSPRFAKALTTSILQQNTMSADGDNKKFNLQNVLGTASGIVNTFGDIFGGKKKQEAEKAAQEAAAKKAQADAEKAKFEAQKALYSKILTVNKVSGAGNNTGVIIGGIVLAVVVVGGIGFAIYKANK